MREKMCIANAVEKSATFVLQLCPKNAKYAFLGEQRDLIIV